ncbi:autophagy-related protein 27 [Spinellus fusiger]|nr:autophagy-related protein 27 [Spinellus fusiger]
MTHAIPSVYLLVHHETTSPTITETKTEINLCNELNTTHSDGSADEDFCRKGTYICRRVINIKKESPRVTHVQEIAGDYAQTKLNATFESPTEKDQDLSKNGTQFSLILHGGIVNKKAAVAHVILECDTSQSRDELPREPVIQSYEKNTLVIYWKTVFACASRVQEEPEKEEPEKEESNDKGISGVGIFFIIVISVAILYFVGGTIYNYKVYNASGTDLIPHYDTWVDLPYLIKDLITHVMDSLSSRRRGDGYTSV